MRQYAAAVILFAAATGCTLPGNSRLGTAGRTVPPPSTGSFGAPDAYYNRRPAGNTAPAAAPRAGTGLGYGEPGAGTLENGWRQSGGGLFTDVNNRPQPAAYEGPVGTGLPPVAEGIDSPRLASANSNWSSNPTPVARGMRVNDATLGNEPRRFSLPANTREMKAALAPPEVDFSASQGETNGNGSLFSAGNAAGSTPGALPFRPPTIRRSGLETPAAQQPWGYFISGGR